MRLFLMNLFQLSFISHSLYFVLIMSPLDMVISILLLIVTSNFVTSTHINIGHLHHHHWLNHKLLPVSFSAKPTISVGTGDSTGVNGAAHEVFRNYNYAKKIPLGTFGFILSPFLGKLYKTQHVTVKKDNPTPDLLVTKKLIQTTAPPKHVVEETNTVTFLDYTSKGVKSIFELKLSSMLLLKKLILTKNQLKTFKFSDLPFLPQLELIDLSFNPLIEIEWNDFRKFVPKLDIIDITGSKIPDDKIAEYTKVSSCTIVNNKVEKKAPILFPETEN